MKLLCKLKIYYYKVKHFFHRIHNEHAILKLDTTKNIVKIRPTTKECRILVNGAAINGETDLDHNDRIVFGSTHIWVFQNPKEKGIAKKQYPPITFEYAQEEIAAKGNLVSICLL